MDRRQKIIVSVVGIFIILLALLGITYGYFLTRIQGNTNETSISITTANLRIVYGDGTKNIVETNIKPSDTIYTKDFTVTNEGNEPVKYDVYLLNVVNQFVHEEDLLMFITCSSNIEGKTCDGYGDGVVNGSGVTLGTSIYPTENSWLLSNTIDPSDEDENVPKEVHTYTLYLMFKDDESDQSDDMGKSLEGKIQILDSNAAVAVTGEVENYSAGDYAEIQSEVQTSQIKAVKDGDTTKYVYTFYGVEPDDEHTLYIKNKASDGSITTVGSQTISVSKGETSSVSSDGSSIVFNDTSLSAKVNISITRGESSSITTSGIGIEDVSSLKDAILADNDEAADNTSSTHVSSSTGIDFTQISSDTNGKGLYYTSTNTEGDKTTYYFRGKVDNNYVRFGRAYSEDVCVHNGNIIDSTFDGSSLPTNEADCLSLCLYDGGYSTTYTQNNCSEYGGMPIDATFGDAVYDLMWRIVRINEDGSIRLILDSSIGEHELSSRYMDPHMSYEDGVGLKLMNWYNSNLLQYADSLTDTGYCTYSTATSNEFGGEDYDLDITRPQFKCTNKFEGKIGLITANEAIYAGGKINTANNNYYLNSRYDYWTITPVGASGGNSTAYRISFDNGIEIVSSGDMYGNADPAGFNAIRPVINISPTLTVVRGTGTILDPYIVK